MTGAMGAQHSTRVAIAWVMSQCRRKILGTTQRDYHETAHAKGEQDSAGAHVKQKCAMAVIRQEAVIRNARDMYDYLRQNFTESTRKNSEVKRRVFFYIEGNITRKGRAFQPVPENRKIHSIQSQGNGKLLIRKRSCYCDHCIAEDYSLHFFFCIVWEACLKSPFVEALELLD